MESKETLQTFFLKQKVGMEMKQKSTEFICTLSAGDFKEGEVC